MSKITNCVSTYNNYNYLKLLIKSVRKNSHFKDRLGLAFGVEIRFPFLEHYLEHFRILNKI